MVTLEHNATVGTAVPSPSVEAIAASHLTFVPGDPARSSWFAIWTDADIGPAVGQLPELFDLDHPEVGSTPDRSDQLELIVCGPDGVRRAMLGVDRVPLDQAVEILASLPLTDDMSPSTKAWAVTVRSALGVIGQGRLLPSVSPDGWDTWRVDPLSTADKSQIDQLAAALPAEAMAAALPGIGEARIQDPFLLVRQCYDAVADLIVRTAAARFVSDSPVFAETAPIRVPHLESWARDVLVANAAGANLILRVTPPSGFEELEVWRVDFQLRSQEDPSLIIDAADLWHAPAEVLARLGDQAEGDLLAGIQRAGAICPRLATVLDEATPSTVSIPSDELHELLDALDELHDASIEVRWPEDVMAPVIERKLVASASSPGDALPTINDLDSLLQVNWEFLLDGVALTSEELDALGDAKRSIVPLRGRWIRLDRKTKERLAAPVPELTAADALLGGLGGDPLGLGAGLLDLDGQGSPLDDALSEALAGAVDLRGDLALIAQRLAGLNGEREQAEPPGLAAELRPYQRRGLAWLSDLCELGLGGCLADDMGLGKTIQLLALHASRSGPTLVVCPTSLIANWEREAHRFCPGTIVHRYHGASRSLSTVEPGDIVVTSYGVVRSDAEALGNIEWDLVVADEAQHLKNPRSRTAKSIRTIGATSRIALTGTPIENRLSELWSIIDWTVPGLLGPLETFRRTVAVPIERDGNSEVAGRLQGRIRPFLLRRKKTDPGIAPELPPKLERDVVVPLTPEQVSLYRATTSEVLADLAENEGFARQGLVLKLLTALKQITNHPAQYLGETTPLAGRSGKLDALDSIVDLAVLGNESTLVFSQYVSMGSLLVDHLQGRHVTAELLHGGLSIKNRQRLVDDFQAGRIPVLVLSLKAGGTGLNLTKATNVVHYDRWWNPAVEDQATDRAYRIGQDRTVTVHRLITEGTVEDRVAELLKAKRALADKVVGSGEGWIGNLDDAELADLVNLTEGEF